MWDRVLEELCGTKVYLDTAFSYGKIPPDYAKKIISAHSADRILLGSDMPWSTAENEAKLIMSLDLPEDTTEKILCNNAKRLLNI